MGAQNCSSALLGNQHVPSFCQIPVTQGALAAQAMHNNTWHSCAWDQLSSSYTQCHTFSVIMTLLDKHAVLYLYIFSLSSRVECSPGESSPGIETAERACKEPWQARFTLSPRPACRVSYVSQDRLFTSMHAGFMHHFAQLRQNKE